MIIYFFAARLLMFSASQTMKYFQSEGHGHYLTMSQNGRPVGMVGISAIFKFKFIYCTIMFYTARRLPHKQTFYHDLRKTNKFLRYVETNFFVIYHFDNGKV